MTLTGGNHPHPPGPPIRFIEHQLATDGEICPGDGQTGRTTDGQPEACVWDGDLQHPARWQPL